MLSAGHCFTSRTRRNVINSSEPDLITNFRLLKAAKLDCAIIHPSNIVQEATQFYVKLLANLLNGQKPVDAIEDAKKVVTEPLVLEIIADSNERAVPVKLSNGKMTSGDDEFQGYFGNVLKNIAKTFRNV